MPLSYFNIAMVIIFPGCRECHFWFWISLLLKNRIVRRSQFRQDLWWQNGGFEYGTWSSHLVMVVWWQTACRRTSVRFQLFPLILACMDFVPSYNSVQSRHVAYSTISLFFRSIGVAMLLRFLSFIDQFQNAINHQLFLSCISSRAT